MALLATKDTVKTHGLNVWVDQGMTAPSLGWSEW
jgi:hypothetical protein